MLPATGPEPSAAAETQVVVSAKQEALGTQPEHNRPGLTSLGLQLDFKPLERR